MKKYRPKPFITEGFQWLGNDTFIPFKDLFEIIPFNVKNKLLTNCQICESIMSEHGIVEENEDFYEILIHPQDWILNLIEKDIERPFLIVRAIDFEQLYELVEKD